MKNGKSGQLEIRPNLRHYQSIRVSLSAPRIWLLPRTLKTITANQCLGNNTFQKGASLTPPLFKIIIDEKGVTDAYENRPIKNLWEVKNWNDNSLKTKTFFFKKSSIWIYLVWVCRHHQVIFVIATQDPRSWHWICKGCRSLKCFVAAGSPNR